MLEADYLACRQLLEKGSRSFAMASRLLPDRVVRPATAFYAFCRVADDLIDLGECPETGLAHVRERVEAMVQRTPFDHPADRAFAAVMAKHNLPRAPVDALVEGFAWDAKGRAYESLGELQDYAARVAGSVGIVMSLLMGARSDAALAAASDLGVAMQLTNIARDVGEDARNGRVYLPRDWLAEAEIDADELLAQPAFSPALANLVIRLLAEAERLYARAENGIVLLPPDCRPAIRAARLIYAEIGADLRRHRADSIARRAVVPDRWKMVLAFRAYAPLSGEIAARRKQTATEPLAANRFMIDAISAASPHRAIPRFPPLWWDMKGRVLPVLSIIEKLEWAERRLDLPAR
ncbi:MAG: phytoene/squalene synthase family protein [Beijerinckiaceae bacterium]|jgi:phytoene synthase|nr:phytoene/squalene synthase family protein [Beijerinckiaceae bacterium]